MTAHQKEFVEKLRIYWSELRGINSREVTQYEDPSGTVFLIVNRPDWPVMELSKSMQLRLLDYTEVCCLSDIVATPELLPRWVNDFAVIVSQQAHHDDKLSGHNVH